MPISIDRFEGGAERRDRTTSERIVRFLATRDARAFTRREIADAIDADPETVGTNLTRLKERDLVRHREPYWAFVDDRERARNALGARYDEDVVAYLLGEDRDGGSDDIGATGAEIGASASTNARACSRPHREAAEAFFERVHDRLDDAIDALYLFGSVAREAETATSDVDVLAVVADDADYPSVDDRLLDIAYDVQLEYDIRLEVHSMRAREFAAREERGDPFVRTVVGEGERGA